MALLISSLFGILFSAFSLAQPPTAEELSRIAEAKTGYRRAYLTLGLHEDVADFKARLDAENWVLSHNRRRYREIPLPDFLRQRVRDVVAIADQYEQMASIIENRHRDPQAFNVLLSDVRARRMREDAAVMEGVKKVLAGRPLGQGVDLEAFFQGYARYRIIRFSNRGRGWEGSDPSSRGGLPLELKEAWEMDLRRGFRPDAAYFQNQPFAFTHSLQTVDRLQTVDWIDELIGPAREVKAARDFRFAALSLVGKPTVQGYLDALEMGWSNFRRSLFFFPLVGAEGTWSVEGINTEMIAGLAPVEFHRPGRVTYFDGSVRHSATGTSHDSAHYAQLVQELQSPEEAQRTSDRLADLRRRAVRAELEDLPGRWTWKLEQHLFDLIHEVPRHPRVALQFPFEVPYLRRAAEMFGLGSDFYDRVRSWSADFNRCNAALASSPVAPEVR